MPESKPPFHKIDRMEDEMRQLEALLQELRQFEVGNPPNERVTKALALVDGVMAPHKEYFLQNRILIIYHGSLQYNDPYHLDLDLTFTTESQGALQNSYKVQSAIEQQFTNLPDWPGMDGKTYCDTNFSSSSVEQISIDQRKAAEASYILTSKALFPEQESLLEEFREKVRKALEKLPVLRRRVIKYIASVISTRQERKAERME